MGLVGRVNQAGECIERLNAIPHRYSRSVRLALAKSSGPVLDFLKGKSPQAARSIPLPYLCPELAWGKMNLDQSYRLAEGLPGEMSRQLCRDGSGGIGTSPTPGGAES